MPLPPLIDAAPGWVRILRLVKVVPLAVFLFGTLLLFNVAQTASLVLIPFSRQAFRRFNRWCANTWWGWCVTASRRLNRTVIVTSGDSVPMAENALLISNHQQMPDIVALMMLARRKDRLGDLKFFVKQALKWVPGAGWGMQYMGFPFLRRDWAADRELILATFDTIITERIPVWLVSFVEGTRSTAAKIEAGSKWAVDHGIEPFRHLLVPRTKGFVATVGALRDHVEAVYDVTIGYEGGVPTLRQYIVGCVRRIHVDVQRIPIRELPTVDDDLRRWLLDRFRHKDELLEMFYRTGTFEAGSEVGGT